MFEPQYLIAWTIYILAGVACCFIWWKITSYIRQSAWQDLARGFVVVLIFTPWYAGESPEFFAPAIVVLLMDPAAGRGQIRTEGWYCLVVHDLF